MIELTTIIGLGKVGQTLLDIFNSTYEEVAGIPHDKVDAWIARWTPPKMLQIIVLAIPAHSISEVVQKLSTLDLHNTLVTHTNGSMQTDVLAPLQERGALIAATHPFQTFADTDISALDGIAWGVECSDDAWEAACEFVDLAGGYAVHLGTLTPDQKRIYHASAVAASNFSYAAYSLARKLADNVGIDATTFLSPIIEHTVRNALHSIERGEPFGITGPLARADEQAVIDQLNALPPELRRTYAACSLGLLDALEVNEETKQHLRTILQKFI